MGSVNDEKASDSLNVIIIGAGIGGLAAAISCLKYGLQVEILEKAQRILPVGAGIQIPPNAARVMRYFSLEEKLQDAGAIHIDNIILRRYTDGKALNTRVGGQKMLDTYGAPWLVIHRADYQETLMKEAIRLGAKLRLNAEVVDVGFAIEEPYVLLKNGDKLDADVIIGADGLWSNAREMLLGHPAPPLATGDLAYRGTFTLEQLKALNDPKVDALIQENNVSCWIGPDKHSVFYPVKNRTQFNLVLLRPDNLPAETSTAEGDIGEMRQTFEGWDGTLTAIISTISSVLKWKLCHHPELRTWVKGNVALLGDATHPTLPYQAQGAAMAAEDGCVLGILLGHLSRLPHNDSTSNARSQKRRQANSLLNLFESLRKRRTTTNVQGALQNQTMYHMPDGPQQIERDLALGQVDFIAPSVWKYGDATYQNEMLSFDCIADTDKAFEQWLSENDGVLCKI